MNKPQKNIIVIGGGTGTFTVLRGLKQYSHKLTAVVSMMDSGGSNRVLRDEFGILPTSDIRQCIVALADENKNEILRDLFTYRYNHGIGITGMTFGNLFMAALTDIYGSQKKAIQKTCELLSVGGKVLPVTFDNSHLIAKYTNGKQVLGEHFIDEPGNFEGEIVDLSLIPSASANPEVLQSILKADLLILGPGDLFTSTIANLVVDGIEDAISKSNAKIIYIMNLMTKFGQTDNYSVCDHIQTLEKYLGGKRVDICLIQKEFSFEPELAKRYEEERATVVKDDSDRSLKAMTIIKGDFISENVYEKRASDALVRSLIRHDSDKLGAAINTIANKL